MINRLSLIARIIRVESATTPKGKVMVTVYVESKDWQGNVVPLGVKAWGQLGQHAIASFKQGDWVVLDGHLTSREYQGKYYLDAVADSISAMNPVGDAAAKDAPPPSDDDSADGQLPF